MSTVSVGKEEVGWGGGSRENENAREHVGG